MIRHVRSRRGAVLPLVALSLVALVGMLALAVDIGMVAIARSQCQNAADSASMAGARTITGISSNNYNLTTVPANAVGAAIVNNVLGTAVQGSTASITTVNAYTYTSNQVKVEVGSYAYTYNDADSSKEAFGVQIPRTDATEPYSAVRATVAASNNYGFARIFGLSTFNTTASATAVHRPRDVVIIMDLSGSMRFQSLAGMPMWGSSAAPSSSNIARTRSMNPESVYPQFGHYSDTAGASLMGNSTYATTTGEYVDPANISTTTNSGPPICADFYSNAIGVAPAAGNVAFTRAPDTYATTPGGDNYLKTNLNTGASYVHTVYDLNNSSTTTIPKFETQGYANYASFNGYTQGPGYWGKTFFVWPPSPGFKTPANWKAPASLTDTTYKWCTWNDSYPNDWRQRFYVAVNTTAGNAPGVIQHNSILFNSTAPYMSMPGDTTTVTENGAQVTYTFRINYAAILYWLNQSPAPFPTTLEGGRIRYYTTRPTGTDNALNNRWWTTAPTSLPNDERFWKEYIDFVLGYTGTGANTYANTQNGIPISSIIGNGDYYTPSGGAIQPTVRADRLPASPSVNPTSPYMTGTTTPYETSTTDAYEVSATAPFQSTTTSAAPAKGATTVAVNSLATLTNANADYIGFGGSTATLYKVTNSSKTSLTITPGLAAAQVKGASVQVYSSNGAVAATKLSVSSMPSLPATATDYVGFNSNIANLYKMSGTTTATQLVLSSGLTASVGVNGISTEIYSSNGAVGATKMSIIKSTQLPTTSPQDYIGFNNSTTNVYKITAAASKSNGYDLTISPGLVTAVAVNNGPTAEIYASDGSAGSTRMSVTLSKALTAAAKNHDYVVFNSDTANPALITDYTLISGTTYILTISALTSAEGINGKTVEVYSPYMDYQDDVARPKHQFWFGPMTFVDWLGNYNLPTGYNGGPHHSWPGNVHEAHAWACKVGISAAIDDIQNNHPSDFVGLTFFSNPLNSNNDTGHHNRAVVPLGRNYQQLKDSLWFPPSTVTGGVSEIGPYDSDMFQVPRADGGTAPGMGFMIAFNQFSSSTANLRFYAQPQPTYRGDSGGLGRKGANRLVIFETDGVPNTGATANLVSSGSDSYYPIRIKKPTNFADPSNVEWPSSNSFALTDVYAVVQQICAQTTASPPGYSTSRKPAQVYSIGYGSDFDPANAGSLQTNALTFLQTVQYYGNTASDTNPSNFPALQRIYGTSAQRISNMQQAFTNIMQSGVQVSLIE